MSTLTAIEVQVRAMSNAELALALDYLSSERGAKKKALVAEAARRLRHSDIYESRQRDH